ncbi:MAG: hypothetical protein IJA59_06935 [Clostridia bacterium]|nr:hypothetical protein [Clostridia bacterium]
MKIKTPLSKEQVRTHLTYSSWKYIALIIASIFGWNLLYTMTAYRSPEHLRVDVYLQSGTAVDEVVDAYFKPVWDACVPDMETVDAVILTSTAAEDAYATMQLSVYIMAGEGDIYMLKTEDFKNYAAQGAFIDLTPYVENGMLNIDDIDVSAGYVAVVDDEGIPTGEKQFFGIPAYTLDGFKTGANIYNRDLVIGVTAFSNNEENVIKFLNGLIEASRVPAAEAQQ